MAYYRPRWEIPGEYRAQARRRAALQRERQQMALLGEAPRQTPQTSGNLRDFIRYASLRRQFGDVARPRTDTMPRPRWGQQIGFGQGYLLPRRQLGGQHIPAERRFLPRFGYAPRTAALLYGGRPRGYGYAPPAMNQMQAMTRYAWSPAAYLGRFWGGSRAVRRWY